MFDISKVTSVYSGTKGCACGCRGKYSYASQFRCDSSKDRGYEVADDEVSDRSVKVIVNKVTHLIRDPDSYIKVIFDANFVAVDMTDRDRTYTIYFGD